MSENRSALLRLFGRSLDPRLLLGLVFLIALALRLLYLADVSGQPFFTAPIVDQASYDRWASQIAATGDWLGKEPFYQDPLYPYFLAVIYKIFGRNLVLVYVFQCIFSAAAVFLIFGIGTRSFKDPRVGLMAALFWAFFQFDWFYQAQLDKTGLGTSLVILALWLTLLVRDRPRLSSALPAGLVWGALFLYRGNFFLVGPPVALWLAVTLYRRRGRAALAPLLVFAVSLGAVLFLTALRNYVVSGQLILTTSQAGENFYLGNFQGNPWGTGVDPPNIRRVPEVEQADFEKEALRRTGKKLAAAELSRFWFRQGLREIAEDPAGALLRLGRKSLLIVNRHELSDMLDYDFFCSRYSRMLRVPLVGYWLVFALGLPGLVLAVIRRRGGLLILYVLSYAATLLLFYVLGRYRMPLAPAFLVLAAYGVVTGAEAVKQGDKKIILVLGSCVLIAAAVSYPRWLVSSAAQSYSNLGNVYARQGQWTESVGAYQEALDRNPKILEAWLGLGVALEQVNRWPEAEIAYQNALRLSPDSPRAHFFYSRFLEHRGRAEEAKQERERARELDPDGREIQ